MSAKHKCRDGCYFTICDEVYGAALDEVAQLKAEVERLKGELRKDIKLLRQGAQAIDEYRDQLAQAVAALEKIAAGYVEDGDCRACDFGPCQRTSHHEDCEFQIARAVLAELEREGTG